MKKNKIYTLLLLSMIMSVFLVILITTLIAKPASGEEWVSGEPKEVDIVTDPTEYLFQLSNMKPGDYAKRELLITNNGRRNFSYFTEIEYKSGSRELMDSFHLTIKDQHGAQLYHGSLLNLTTDSFEMRYLPVLAKDLLVFTIEFVDSGQNQNYLQNKAAIFELSLKAEEYINRDLGFKKITGGGNTEHKKNTGKSYGFNVLPKNEGLSVNLQYTDHDSGFLKNIHVNDYAYNVNEIIDNNIVVGIEFDVIGEIDKELGRLHIRMIDYGEPGRNDNFFLGIIEGTHEGYNSGDENITGGNIQIHR